MQASVGASIVLVTAKAGGVPLKVTERQEVPVSHTYFHIHFSSRKGEFDTCASRTRETGPALNHMHEKVDQLLP